MAAPGAAQVWKRKWNLELVVFRFRQLEVCDAVFTAKVANQSARRAKPFPGQPIARTPFITVRFSSSTTSHLVTSHFRDIHLK